MWKIKVEYDDKSKLTLTGKGKDIPPWLAREYYQRYVEGRECKATYQQYPKNKYGEISLSDKIEQMELPWE